MAECADDCQRHADVNICGNVNEAAWHVVLRKVADPLDYVSCDACKVWVAENLAHKVVVIEPLNP